MQPSVKIRRFAQAAKLVGAILVLGGLGHLAGVLFRVWHQGLPSGDRLAFLMFVAVAHWTGGALNLVAAAALRRGEDSALALLAIALGLIGGWAAIQAPAFVHHPSLISSGPLTYLVAQAALFTLVRSELAARER